MGARGNTSRQRLPARHPPPRNQKGHLMPSYTEGRFPGRQKKNATPDEKPKKAPAKKAAKKKAADDE